MAIRITNLSKCFGSRPVLRDVSLSVERGDVMGLIGPNGAGKSTLLKAITGLIWPTAGTVTVNGFDVHREHPQAMRKLGAVIEWPSFHPDLSARWNLKVFSGGHGPAYEKRSRELLRFVGMDSAADRRVGTFSTGMKQRLGIVLALLPDSDLIILDEPTNGLDPGGIVEIRQLIRQLNRDFGTTVLVSSHLLGEMEQICDKIALLSQGTLIACGGLQELLKAPPQLCVHCRQPALARRLLQEAGELAPRSIVVTSDRELRLEYAATADCDRLAGLVNARLVHGGVEVTHLSVAAANLETFFLENLAERR